VCLLLSRPRRNRLTALLRHRARHKGSTRDPCRYLLLSWPTKLAAIISWEVSIPIKGINVRGIARHDDPLYSSRETGEGEGKRELPESCARAYVRLVRPFDRNLFFLRRFEAAR